MDGSDRAWGWIVNEHPPVIGIDLGSSKVSVVVGEMEEERLVVRGCGQATHDGARKGVIASLEEVSQAVRVAAEEAEERHGRGDAHEADRQEVDAADVRLFRPELVESAPHEVLDQQRHPDEPGAEDEAEEEPAAVPPEAISW